MIEAADRPTFGKLLREFRIAAGLSQEGLAERARLSVDGIGALERGINKAPQRETLALLLKRCSWNRSSVRQSRLPRNDRRDRERSRAIPRNRICHAHSRCFSVARGT